MDEKTLDALEHLCSLATQSGCTIKLGSGKDAIEVTPVKSQTAPITDMAGKIAALVFAKK